MVFLDVVLGVLAVVALWWRRRWPLTIALFIAAVGVVSASFAAGAGLLALFNVALRGSRRAIAIATVAGLVVSVVVPLDLRRPGAPVRLRGRCWAW